MKQKVIVWFMMIIGLASASPCLAGGQDPQTAPAVEEIKARVAEAKAKGYRVTVKLNRDASLKLGRKRGASVNGKVTEIMGKGFTLTDRSPFDGQVNITIDYADVASVKRQSSAVKVFRDIGQYSLFVAAGAVAVPLYFVAGLLGMKC
jgi:hypothetical protein